MGKDKNIYIYIQFSVTSTRHGLLSLFQAFSVLALINNFSISTDGSFFKRL